MKRWKIAIAIAVATAAIVAAVCLRSGNQTAQFRRALYSGDISQVESFLKSHPALANANDMGRGANTGGWTPLHVAANLGDPDLVKLLVHYGAKVDARDQRGLTPLLWTAFSGRRDAAAALLSDGADINARGPDGRTTLDLAKLSLDNSLIDLLRERGAKD